MIKDNAEILIVGAGIMGLTIARELIAEGADNIVILEKEGGLGYHASGRNSGVLHAGIYYAPDTLKAKSCLNGNRLMKQYCLKKGLPVLDKGKVIIARSESEIPTLEELHRRALANGARVEMICPKELERIEPSAKTIGKALLSYDTCQVDPKAILYSLKDELEASKKVTVLFNCQFIGLQGSATASTNRHPIRFSKFVNTAGAHCDRVAKAFGIAGQYRLIPFKGIYYKLKKNAPCHVNGNIYPVPDIRNPFLGVHFTRNIHGDVYLGPTAIPAFGRENYEILKGIEKEALNILMAEASMFANNPKFRNVALTEPRKYFFPFFFKDAQKLVKDLAPEHIEPCSKVGIRAQLVDWRTKEMVMDFMVYKDGDALHLLNPVSPAFTCSLDLAKRLVERMKN